MSTDLRSIRAFIFDMDGVIYRGKRVLPCAPEFVARLRRDHVPFLFLTNNSTAPPRDVADRLADMGIDAKPVDIISSAEATASYLAEQRPGCRVLVVGETGIRHALTAMGFTLTADHGRAEAVVVGMDREATYARLKEASLAIQAGALFLATNRDASLPSEEGLIPGAGSLVGMLEIASGRQATSIGKPAAGIFRRALARLGAPAETAACIGDRPETDILGGQAAGLRTIAMLTGVAQRHEFESMQPPPDWIFDDLCELQEAYFTANQE
ncbi:MAG: HAD-IIA family hydrolase [Nitrososphaerales archaeon]